MLSDCVCQVGRFIIIVLSYFVHFQNVYLPESKNVQDDHDTK